MKNLLIAVVLSLLFFGCVTTTSKFSPLSEKRFNPHKGNVKIYSTKPDDCTEIGWVTASSRTYNPEWLDILELVKSEAAKNGATGVIFSESSAKPANEGYPRSIICLAIRQDSKY